MDYLFTLLATVMAAIYSVVPSYGITIAALTLAVMVVLTPLTLKGTRSMMMMQQLQPEMKKLQSRYKDDRQKLNEELLKFYKENNINPVGGCLPLLIQMPVFIVLYNVLRGMTIRVTTMGGNVGWVAGQQYGVAVQATKPPVVHNNFQPFYLPQDTQMYRDLASGNTMPFGHFWTIDLSQSASEVLSLQGLVHALPYLILIVIVGISGFVQQRQIQGRQSSSNAMPQQQQQIMKIMPIFLPVISFGLPAGLVLYFAVSNLYRIGQQWFISRQIYGLKRGQTLDDLEKQRKSDGKAGAIETTAKKSSGGRATDTKKRPAQVDAAPTSNGSNAKVAKAKASTGRGANGSSDAADGAERDNGNGAAPAKTGSGRAKRTTSGAPSAPDRSADTGPKGPSTPPLQPRARKKKR